MDGILRALPERPVRLLEQFRFWLRQNQYSYRTEQTYVHWVIKYIRFHNRRHPSGMGTKEIAEPARLVCELLYGSGLRVSEALRLRIKDIDFDRRTITVHQGKGEKDRITMLPRCTESRLREQIARASRLYGMDRRNGIRLPPTYLSTDTIYAPCRSYWDTAMLPPLSAIFMFSIGAGSV